MTVARGTRAARRPPCKTTGAPRRKPRHIEEDHQIALVKWAAHHRLPALPHIDEGATVADYLAAIPNGGGRSKVEAARLKAQGVKAGVWDLILALPMHGAPGLWIEMKAPKIPATDITAAVPAGRPSDEQLVWGRRMAHAGYVTAMCWGWDAARDAILTYLRLGDTAT